MKGWLDPAVREVLEETGVEIRLGRPLRPHLYTVSGGRSKKVHYWVGHVIGDLVRSAPLGPDDIAAAIIKPFVDEKLHWMCQNHGVFQGYYFFHYLGMDRDMREQFRGHPHFEDTARFCELYDQTAFDPSYDTAPLDFFEPMVQRFFAAPKRSIYVSTAE